MTSHLPAAVVAKLEHLAAALDGGLQADGHKVSKAIAVDTSFDQSYIDSGLTRALICAIACSTNGSGMLIEPLATGGCEAVIVHDGIERRFRLKKAMRDQRGFLSVMVSSDSLLVDKAREATLFDSGMFNDVVSTEQWVLAYLIHPTTRTIMEMWAAMPVDVLGQQPPFRLALDRLTPITVAPLTPPPFPKSDDDLGLGDDETEEGDEEESG